MKRLTVFWVCKVIILSLPEYGGAKIDRRVTCVNLRVHIFPIRIQASLFERRRDLSSVVLTAEQANQIVQQNAWKIWYNKGSVLCFYPLRSPRTPNKQTLLERLFPNSRLIGPNQMQRHRWLDKRLLLTEGGFPESRGRWKGRGGRLGPQNYTMRLLWLGLGVISGEPF